MEQQQNAANPPETPGAEAVRTNVKLSFGTKLAFAMGDFYAGGFFNLVNFYYAFFLTDVVGINPAWAGAIFTVSKIWDAVTDPLMGAISDRTKGRFGRRRPYFLYGVPLVILSIVWMWYPVSFDSEMSRVLFCGIAYMFANTVATFVQVPFLAMSAELSTDYNERNSITSVRMVISLFSSLLCAVAPMLIVAQFREVKTGYFVMGVVFGLLFALPWLITFFKVKEPEAFVESATKEKGIFRPMLKTLRVRSFRRLNYIYLGIFVTLDLIAMIMAYFMTYVMQRPDELSLVLGLLLLCEIIGIPFATMAANKTSKIRVIIIGSVGWIVGTLLTLFMGPSSPAPLMYILSGSIGFVMSFSLVGIISIFGDVTDVGELYFGVRMEGAFSGVQQFIRKCASAIANGLALGLLSLAGFINPINEVTQAQPPAVLWTIRGITGLVATLLLVPTIIICLKWQLTPERQAKLIHYLDHKRAGLPITPEEQAEMDHLRDHVL